MKGDIGWNLSILGVDQDSRPMRFLSYALVSRNWYKTVSNSYENLYIYEMSYKNSGFKHVHTQSENDNIPEKPDILIIFLL